MPHFLIKISDDLFTQIRQLIVAQRRQDASNVLQISLVCRIRQLLRSYISHPVFDVLCQRNAAVDGFGGMLNLTLKQNRLLLYPLFRLLWRILLGWLDGFLHGFQSVSLVVIPTGYYNQVTVTAAFSDRCHVLHAP